ncbi:hypothetical protein [Leptolyngbya sp. FACHB-17]|uniref:hypothetical protein n=1 Tax=unclassified Leptolyngbya TaxID=2650499 RepID=UPI001680A605|nr:hypothetical protein [Leptolyngbya sp. FACHB-17]MBD2079608.1 hypothetical protein [Leptolyngbya sp. FACHB-17]
MIYAIDISQLSGLSRWSRPFVEDINANVKNVERDSGCNGGIDRQGNTGKIDEDSNDSGN